jgi:hypothetical protein
MLITKTIQVLIVGGTKENFNIYLKNIKEQNASV